MYLNLNTQQQLTEQQIRAAHFNTSFPAPFRAPDGYAVVFPAPRPPYDFISQQVREILPELTVLGNYEQRFEVIELDPEQVAANQAAEVLRIKALVPKSVTMRQARLALLENGLLAAVQSAVASMQGTDGDKARIEWEFSSTVERDKGLVLSFASALSITEEQLDALFTQASLL